MRKLWALLFAFAIIAREGLTFHDGSPLTTEDVAFTYENYTGTGAATLQDMLEEIEIVDDRSITFHFTGPFLDFMLLYGSTATGAGWILPSDYYQEVGAEGFLEAPIGAGPFKFVENQDNVKIVYEAFDDYWRKNPGVETINFNAITDPATRYAGISTGELDLASCAFAPRCPVASERCREEEPPLVEIGVGHSAACWNRDTFAVSLVAVSKR
jgi:peptide/nickel transport system substrate-binding protein